MEQPKQHDQDERLREIEQGLIDRIADVDDDRRRTATALQRALDTHTEEMDAKLRRSKRTTAAFAAVAILVALVALWFAFRLPAIDIEGELARMKQDVVRMTAVSGEENLLHEKLTGLAEMVSDISTSLEMLELERAERGKADADLAKRLERSEVLQGRMTSEMDALRTALAEAPSTSEDETKEPSADSSPQTESATAAVPAVEPAPVEGTETPTAAEVEESGRNTTQVPSVHESNLVLDDRHYAMQLIGFYNLDALRGFADRDDMPSQLYYRRESLRGRPWYVLIHSLHTDLASAVAARSTLPSDLAALDIWIRPLGEGTQLEVFEFVANAP